MNITSAQMQGPRPYQEDCMVQYVGSDGNYLLAVFDGHGGAECAVAAMNYAGAAYEDNLLTTKTNEGHLLAIIHDIGEVVNKMDSGSTASIVLIDKDFTTATVGILGDSPVYIKTTDGFFLSDEHNVRTNVKEKEALIARGGAVTWDGNYAYDPQDFSLANKGRGLQMTRALGDYHLDRILLREPSISVVPLTDDSVILIGSDGLFDPSHMDGGQSFKDIQYMLSNPNVGADQLIKFRETYGAGDNVSAIVVRK